MIPVFSLPCFQFLLHIYTKYFSQFLLVAFAWAMLESLWPIQTIPVGQDKFCLYAFGGSKTIVPGTEHVKLSNISLVLVFKNT